ncbi:MAG: ABC transporter ATP-binding protein [Betaproteobacteria bacterium]|nr:ABC transporter ATP-binding protein [Betaproteobacteria bacterium]
MLAIDDVSFRYSGAPDAALAAVNLTIPADGVYGLLGPNGAGKTTLISLLSGLLTATGGTLRIDGQPLAAFRREHPQAIALVPQEHAFYPMLTVAENLAFFAGVLGLAGHARAAAIEAAVAFARLEQVAGKRAEQLSGGLRRRLNLAIGLLGAPRLLLLDEPTVGVDPQSRSFLLESIARLPAAGTTVIYTSHYMEEVEAICQRIAILARGQVLAEGTLAELLRDGEAAAEFELDRPPPAAIAAMLEAMPGCDLKFRLRTGSTATLAALLEQLAGASCTVRQLAFGRQNLEQLFMRLTRRSLRD